MDPVTCDNSIDGGGWRHEFWVRDDPPAVGDYLSFSAEQSTTDYEQVNDWAPQLMINSSAWSMWIKVDWKWAAVKNGMDSFVEFSIVQRSPYSVSSKSS